MTQYIDNKSAEEPNAIDRSIARDNELLMLITWFSRIIQLATDMTTWNNYHVRNAQECLQEITLVAKEGLGYLNMEFEK